MSNHTDDNLSDGELLHFVTQDTRGRIIQDILGHPFKSPSFNEIDFMNPGRSPATLREHLDKLIEEGIVRRVELPEDRRERGSPYTFYTLSESGRDLLEEHNLYVDEEDEIEWEYSQVEKPERIHEYENAPRPEEIGEVTNGPE